MARAKKSVPYITNTSNFKEFEKFLDDHYLLDLVEQIAPKPSKSFNTKKFELKLKEYQIRVYPVRTRVTDYRDDLNVAFILRYSRAVYGVWVNPFYNPVLTSYILTHEYGHILCNHSIDVDNDFIKFCIKYKQELEGLLKIKIDGNAQNEDKFKRIWSHVSNVAQDLEINSTLFGDKAIDLKNGSVYISIVDECRRRVIKGDDVDNIRDYLSDMIAGKVKKPVGGCFPEDYGYVKGLHWEIYLDLLMRNELNAMSQQGYFTSAASGDLSDAFVQEIDRDVQNLARDSGSPDADSVKSKGSGRGVKKYVDKKTGDTVAKILNKMLVGVKPKEIRSDPLYYSLRGKHTDVIVPRRSEVIDSRSRPTVWLMVDCSGSMNFSLISEIVNTVRDCDLRFDMSHSHLVMWSTGLEDDLIMKSVTDIANYSGGTDLGPGIEYCCSRMRRQDKFVLVSDFEDNIERLAAAADKYPHIEKFGILDSDHSPTVKEVHEMLGKRFRIAHIEVSS